jgi:hypothetical protein
MTFSSAARAPDAEVMKADTKEHPNNAANAACAPKMPAMMIDLPPVSSAT